MTEAPFERSFYNGPATNYLVGTVIQGVGTLVGTITAAGPAYYDVTLLPDVEHFTRHILIHRREAIRPEEAEVRRAWLEARDKLWRLGEAEAALVRAQKARGEAYRASREAEDALRAAQEALEEAGHSAPGCPRGTPGCARTDCSPAPGHSCHGPNAPRHSDMEDTL